MVCVRALRLCAHMPRSTAPLLSRLVDADGPSFTRWMWNADEILPLSVVWVIVSMCVCVCVYCALIGHLHGLNLLRLSINKRAWYSVGLQLNSIVLSSALIRYKKKQKLEIKCFIASKQLREIQTGVGQQGHELHLLCVSWVELTLFSATRRPGVRTHWIQFMAAENCIF